MLDHFLTHDKLYPKTAGPGIVSALTNVSPRRLAQMNCKLLCIVWKNHMHMLLAWRFCARFVYDGGGPSHGTPRYVTVMNN